MILQVFFTLSLLQMWLCYKMYEPMSCINANKLLKFLILITAIGFSSGAELMSKSGSHFVIA